MYLTNEFDLYKISFQYLLTYQKKSVENLKYTTKIPKISTTYYNLIHKRISKY